MLGAPPHVGGQYDISDEGDDDAEDDAAGAEGATDIGALKAGTGAAMAGAAGLALDAPGPQLPSGM